MKPLQVKILPIVVLYQQSFPQSLSLQSLQRNLEKLNTRLDVFIYDNSPDAQSTKQYFCYKSLNIIYHHDPSNSGLSKAYNTGAAYAQKSEKKWLLLLDQDTAFPSDFLQVYEQSIKENPDISLFAPVLKIDSGIIFSPCITRHKRGYPPGQVIPGRHSLWKFSPVNSGILVNLDLFLKVGGYNEKVKIDFCDFQFLEKVRLVSPDFVITTTVGSQNFSAITETYMPKQLQRFKIYLEDASNCIKPSFSDRLGFFYTVTRHALGLSLKLRNLSFLRLYFHHYLIRK
jgi:rhamnosyltransferase